MILNGFGLSGTDSKSTETVISLVKYPSFAVTENEKSPVPSNGVP